MFYLLTYLLTVFQNIQLQAAVWTQLHVTDWHVHSSTSMSCRLNYCRAPTAIDHQLAFFSHSLALTVTVLHIPDCHACWPNSVWTARSRVWNALPVDVISSTTLPAFKRLLKTELFSRSFPDAWYSSSCTWLLELIEWLTSWHCKVVF